MNLLIYTLRAISGALVTPPLVFVLLILSVSLFLKNKKIVSMQKMILGGRVNSALELTLSQLVLGIIAGTIGSVILNSLGVVFDENSGIIYLFLISILLMFFKPRLICFSYSAAILGAISILLTLLTNILPELKYQINFNINILSLMMFVGILHIVEGILVMIDGDRGAIPVFMNKDGKILGGYAFKRYWVLPIAIMLAINIENSSLDYLSSAIEMPKWWPLINSFSTYTTIATSMISIFPLYAMLGYSSITFTMSKKEKAISSGLHIMSYGLILTLVAQLSRIGILGQIVVVVFAPFAHEFMLKCQRKNEQKRVPKFVSDEEGLTVLAISETSELNKFGVETGNKILAVNNKNINSEAEVYSILKENLYNAILKIKNSKGVIEEINFRHNKNSRLGILLVPRNIEKEETITIDQRNFENTLKEIKNKKIIQDREIESNKKNKNL